MNLLAELRNKNVVLITTSKKNAHPNMIKCLQSLQDYGKRLGFFSFQYPLDEISEDFKRNNLPIAKFYFVDALTAAKSVLPVANNCIFVSSPSSMTEIRISIKTLFSEKNRDLIFIEGITEMEKYFNKYELTRFIQEMIMITNSYARKLVIFAQNEDSTPFIMDLSMFAEKIIEL